MKPDQDAQILASEYPDQVLAVDTGFVRPRMASCYLLEGGDEYAVIETGTNHTTPRLLSVLARRGIRREQVRWVIVTHVHLDHAGGAGSLMAALPEARLVVHPRGARHLVDPTRLEASVRQVYGDDAFDAMYGVLQPVAEARLLVAEDGDEIDVGGRQLGFHDTPGHARHHFCVWDAQSRGWFTGDTFGLSYRELDTASGPFIFPTTTPIEFDPDALHASINLLMEREPQYMYLTHYGRISRPQRLAPVLHRQVDELVEMTLAAPAGDAATPALEQVLRDWLDRQLDAHGCQLDARARRHVLEGDVRLNAQGLLFWRQKEAKS